jgi:hypothetical protein
MRIELFRVSQIDFLSINIIACSDDTSWPLEQLQPYLSRSTAALNFVCVAFHVVGMTITWTQILRRTIFGFFTGL